MAEELLNDSFSLQADQQVGPNPGPQPFSYETLFNSLNKGKGVTLPDGKVAKNAAELRDNLSIPKNAPEATPAYNEAVERQKAFFDVYQEPIKSFGILRNTEFSGVLQGQPRDFEKTAIKQKQEVSKILPPTSVVEKTPVANMIKQRVDNQVSAMQKAFDGVPNDQIEEMVYKAEVLGDDSASVIVKDKIVVPRLVYGELEEQEIGTPVEGGYQITYSDYKTYLKDVLGMRGEESRYDLPETERFLYESEELGASEPVNEIAQNTMNLKEMFIDKKASQKLEQNLIENSDYLSVLDTRSKSLLSEDEKKIADKTESIEKEVNDLFSEAFLSKYSSKEEATKAIQEKRDRIKILEAEAAQMRKGAGLAPNQLFNPISGKLEDATPEEKQNLELGIQSATAKYFGGGTQTPLTRSSMINDRNLLWNKLDYLDEEIKNTEAEARRLGFSLSKVGALQQTTGLRNAVEIQKVKSLEKRFNNLLNERATNYGSLLTLNRAIYTNEDVFKKQSDALLRLAESLSEDLYVVNIFTDKNTVRSRVQQVNEMTDYFNSKGVQLTPTQVAATEETLSESLGGSVGNLINVMVDIGLTSGLVGGVAKLATTNKYYDAAKLYMTTRAGRAGKFGVSLFERSLPTILQGAAFELADQSFTTGIAESVSERGFDRFVGKGLEKFSGKYGKLSYALGRWLSGTSGEFVAEVSGEVANIMTENGYDLVGAFEDAYGKDVDQVTKSMAQLGLTVAFMAAPQNFGYLIMTDKKFREHIAQFGTNPVLEEVHMLIKNTIESTPRTAAGNKLGEQLYKNTPVDPLVFTPTEQGPELERLNVEQRAANNGEEFYLVENNGEVNTDVVYKVDATTGELMVKGFNPLVEGFTKASETLVNKVNEQSTTNGIISSDKATDIAARNLNVNKVTTKDGKVLYQAPGQSVEQFNQNRTKNINSTKTLAENRFAPFRELAKSIMKTIFPNVKAEVSDQQASVYNSYRDKVRGVLKLNAGSFFADGVAVLMESGMNKVPKIADFVAPLLEAFSKTGRVVRVAEEGSTETSRSVSLNSVLDSIVDSEFFQERFGDTADALNHAKTLLSDLLLNDKAIIESVLKDSTKVKDFLKFRENFNKFVAKNYTGAASYTSNQSFYRNQMPDTLIKSREEEFEMTKKEQLSERDKRNDIGRVLSAAGIPVNAKNIESVRYLNGDISAQQLLDVADVDTTGMSEADMQARANAEARDVDIRKFGEAVKNRKENEKRRKQNIKTLTNALSTKFGMNLFQSFKDSGLLNGLDVFSKRRTVARIMNRIIESAATREGVTAEQFLNDMLEFEKMKEEEFRELYENNPDVKILRQRIGDLGARRNQEIEERYELAKQKEKEGVSAEKIYLATGWTRGADGRWKYQYTNKNRFIPPTLVAQIANVKSIGDDKVLPLSTVYGDSGLYDIYPELRATSVHFIYNPNLEESASFQPETGDIVINRAKVGDTLDLEMMLAHEVQHAVQNLEGWQRGTSPSAVLQKNFYDLNGYIDDAVSQMRETYGPNSISDKAVQFTKSFFTGGANGLFSLPVAQTKAIYDVLAGLSDIRISDRQMPKEVFDSVVKSYIDTAVANLSQYTTTSKESLRSFLTDAITGKSQATTDLKKSMELLNELTAKSIYFNVYGEKEATMQEEMQSPGLRMAKLRRIIGAVLNSENKTEQQKARASELFKRITDNQRRYEEFCQTATIAFASEAMRNNMTNVEIAQLEMTLNPNGSPSNYPFDLYNFISDPRFSAEQKEFFSNLLTIKTDLGKDYFNIVNDALNTFDVVNTTENVFDKSNALAGPTVFFTPEGDLVSRRTFEEDFLTSENPMDWSNAEFGSMSAISNKKKDEYRAMLEKKRPDLAQDGLIDSVLDEVQKFGEENSQNNQGNPKLEKLAMYWIANGNVILPEDGYKVVEAERLATIKKVDPFSFKNPLELIDKYKAEVKEVKVDPDTIKEFKDKKELGELGITIYTVDDTREGQAAVRRMIDSHFGKDANPWCLAARLDGDPNMDQAWYFWSDRYNAYPKKIAFKNGKLVAFSANSYDEEVWWDRMDSPNKGIMTKLSYGANPNMKREVYVNGEGKVVKEGDITEEINSKDSEGNKLKTERKYYSEGKVEWEQNYKNGELNGPTRYFSTTGELMVEENYKDGQPDGVLKRYYSGGQLASEVPWKDGEIDGVQKHYYENGQLEREKNWKNGNHDGVEKIYYENGQLEIERNYKKNRLSGIQKTYYKNGNIKFEEGYEDGLETGPFVVYYSNGNIQKQSYYEDGKKEGTEIEYYQDGKIKTFKSYVDGKKEGKFTEYYEDGKIKTFKSYVDGKKEGKFTEYYEDGTIRKEEEYYENKEQGVHKEYFRNGQLAEENVYVNGKQEGISKIYYENGQLAEEVTYVNDKKQGVQKRYYDNGNLEMQASFKDGLMRGPVAFYYRNGQPNIEYNMGLGYGENYKGVKIYNPDGTRDYSQSEMPYQDFVEILQYADRKLNAFNAQAKLDENNTLRQGTKAAVVIGDTKSIIFALTNPDVSSPIHEIVHVYEKYLTPEEKAQILQATGETEWSVNTSEYFARGFERFLYDGEAPSEGLIGMFNKFREWLLEIYNSLVSSEIDVNLTPQVKDIYAAMLGEPRVEQKAEPAMAAPQTFTNELSTFIGERRSQGLSDDQIYQGLLEAGFKLEDLEPFFDTATRRTVESNLDPESPFRAESVMMADEASGNYVKRTADELLKEVNSMSAEEQEAVLDSIAENSMMDVAVYKLIQDIITKQQNGEDITSDYERLVAIGTNLGRALQRFTELRKRSMSLRTESLIRKFEQDKKRTIPQAIKERLKTISTQFDKKKEEYEKARQLAGENASAISPIDSRYTNMELFKKLERELEGLAETYAKLSAPYVDKASYSKTAKTLIQGNLLTPNSGMVNIAANTIKSILNVPVNIISSIVSKFFPGTTSTYRGLGYYGAALKYGFMQGGRNAARIIRKGNIPETIQTLEIQNGFNGFRSLSQLLGSLLDAARGESSEEIATKYGYSLNQAGKIPKKEVAIKAWEGIVGLPAEMMFRFLGSADALFKNTAYFGALYEQAMIEVAAGRLDKSDVDNFIKLNSDFTNDVAKNEALRFVYANRTPVSKFIGGALNIKSTDNVFVKAGKLAGSGVIPYVNVPTNIIAEYAQFMIPEYGGVMASVYTKQALDAKKKMDSAKNPQNKLKAEAEMLTNRRRAEEAAARAAVGFGLSMLIKTFVDSGAISASAQDEDEKRKDFIYRFERPYSINLSLLERARKGENDGFWRPGDAVRDYRFLGVVGGMMFISAKEARNAEKEKRKETATASLWNQLDNIPLPNIKETLQYVIEQSFLRGLNQMMQAFDPRQADRGGFERAATGLLTTLSAAILPNSFSIIDRMNRTYVPEFDSPYQGFEKIQYDFINKIKERWPFDDPNSLPAKVDPFGKRILQTPEDRNAFIYNTFDITKFTKALGGKGDITWEMLVMAAVKKGGDISAMPSNPSPEITPIAGPKYSMSQEEYQAYAIALGEARRRIVNGFIQGTDLKEFISPDSELNRQTGPDLNTPLGYYLLGKTLSKLYSAGDAVLFNEKRAIISEQRRKLAIERPKEFQALVEREKNSIYGEAISELYSDPELENYKQYLGNINLQAPSLENLEEIKFDFEKGKEILEMTEPNQGEEGVSGELTEFNKKWLESINKKKGIKK